MKIKQLKDDFKDTEQDASSERQISEVTKQNNNTNVDQIKKGKRGRPRKSEIKKPKNEVIKKKILKQRASKKSLQNTIEIDAAQNDNVETSQQIPPTYHSNCDNPKCICNSCSIKN